jgi:hypothetical protein
LARRGIVLSAGLPGLIEIEGLENMLILVLSIIVNLESSVFMVSA